MIFKSKDGKNEFYLKIFQISQVNKYIADNFDTLNDKQTEMIALYETYHTCNALYLTCNRYCRIYFTLNMKIIQK